jgi:hypothetical protein
MMKMCYLNILHFFQPPLAVSGVNSDSDKGGHVKDLVLSLSYIVGKLVNNSCKNYKWGR